MEISLVASAAGDELSVYLGDSASYLDNSLCASIPARQSSSEILTLNAVCSGVGRYLHIVMPGQNKHLQIFDVSAMGCVIDSPPIQSACPVGEHLVASACVPCPAGWTTDGNVAGPEMWQRCNVACTAAMLEDPSSGCNGAWYTTYSSCSSKCSGIGMSCNLESLVHSS